MSGWPLGQPLSTSGESMAVNKKDKQREGQSALFKVTTKRDGFRRAGREWRGTTIVSKDQLTAVEWQQLNSDAVFIVEAHSKITQAENTE